MFIGFNLEAPFKNEYFTSGQKVFNKYRTDIKKELDGYLLEDGSIDGSKMQSDWFPNVKADIFISHSHRDENKALALAGWLNDEFGLQAFIDSCIWGYSIELLKEIDNKYCRSKDGTMYDYDLRNYSTSHVHMMLSTALTMMIDKTECVFFLNTPNSISTSDSIQQTNSPWIYHELGMTRLIRKRTFEDHREGYMQKSLIFEAASSLNIKYNVPLNHLISLSDDDLQIWYRKHNLLQRIQSTSHPLDALYNIKKTQIQKVQNE